MTILVQHVNTETLHLEGQVTYYQNSLYSVGRVDHVYWRSHHHHVPKFADTWKYEHITIRTLDTASMILRIHQCGKLVIDWFDWLIWLIDLIDWLFVRLFASFIRLLFVLQLLLVLLICDTSICVSLWSLCYILTSLYRIIYLHMKYSLWWAYIFLVCK